MSLIPRRHLNTFDGVRERLTAVMLESMGSSSVVSSSILRDSMTSDGTEDKSPVSATTSWCSSSPQPRFGNGETTNGAVVGE